MRFRYLPGEEWLNIFLGGIAVVPNKEEVLEI